MFFDPAMRTEKRFFDFVSKDFATFQILRTYLFILFKFSVKIG